jgi:hypothetical protein
MVGMIVGIMAGMVVGLNEVLPELTSFQRNMNATGVHAALRREWRQEATLLTAGATPVVLSRRRIKFSYKYIREY